jgi:GNAT superfamily N-acetyltransferase
VRIIPASADHPDSVRLLSQYFDELRFRLGAFEPSRSISASADEMAGERGVFLLAYAADGAVDGPVACGGMKLLSPGIGEIKRMYVVPEVRRGGYGRQVLDALEGHASARGVRRLVLDTADPLTEAAALYARAGYVEISPYNDNPYAARWFAKYLA